MKVNAANEHGDTPLHLASRWGYGKLYSEVSCYRGHMLRYPDGDVVSETITKFSFTLDFRIILTTTPPHVKNGQRQTQSEKSGHVVVSAFCCLPSLFIQFLCQAIRLLVDLSTEGRGQKISSQLDGKSIKLLAKWAVSWLHNRQAARQ